MGDWEPMPLTEWADTKDTLHRYLQVVGKVRLAGSARRNHWWNVPLHLTGRGLTTRPLDTDPGVCLDLDLVDHRLLIHGLDGRTVSSSLLGSSVASFYAAVTDGLATLGVDLTITRPTPFDLPDSIPFAADTEHASYDPVWVGRYWRTLSRVALLLERYAAGFNGKISPVHHFWHTMDIAVTRFSDVVVPQEADTDPVTREAYSREVVSAGFWFGDAAFAEAAFYSYTAPEPAGLAEQPLEPASAEWVPSRGAHLAVLRYSDALATEDPGQSALTLWDSAYQAGAGLAGWDLPALACQGGVTDPHLAGR